MPGPARRIQNKMIEPTLSCLATVTEDGKPWVRYVTAMADDDLTIRFTTMPGSRKVAHIKNNHEVHLVTGVTSPETAESYIQVQGTPQEIWEREPEAV